jgi:hypothetical protein
VEIHLEIYSSTGGLYILIMANILKRPMFRRGGSAAYDVGITSGLGF